MADSTSLPAAASGVLACVVTDDDALSRRTLENHIATTPDLTLAGSFVDGMQLLDFLRTRPHIDILFLDVQMPELSGLDVIRLLPTAPDVVLITSRADFAVEAFELQVTDYVVKPIGYPRFMQVVERVRDRRSAPRPVPAPPAFPLPAGRDAALFVKSGGRMVRVAFDDIVYLEAVNDQTVVVTTTRQFSVSQLLREIASRLPEPQFMRVHRTYLVNRRRIEAVELPDILMEGGRSVPIGRTYLLSVLASFPTV